MFNILIIFVLILLAVAALVVAIVFSVRGIREARAPATNVIPAKQAYAATAVAALLISILAFLGVRWAIAKRTQRNDITKK